MGTSRRRQGRLSADLERDIRRLAREGHTPTEIAALLSDNYKKVPDIRSIRWRVKVHGPPPDTSSPWSLAAADPEDAALVLPVLAEAIERGRGHWQRFSKDLAGWIVKVRLAAPDMPPFWALYIAQEYFVRERRNEPVEGLDQMLAFAPWREKPQLYRYLRAMNRAHPSWFKESIESLGSLTSEGAFPDPLWAFLGPVHQHVLRGEPGAVGVLIAVECWEAREEKGAPDD